MRISTNIIDSLIARDTHFAILTAENMSGVQAVDSRGVRHHKPDLVADMDRAGPSDVCI